MADDRREELPCLARVEHAKPMVDWPQSVVANCRPWLLASDRIPGEHCLAHSLPERAAAVRSIEQAVNLNPALPANASRNADLERLGEGGRLHALLDGE